MNKDIPYGSLSNVVEAKGTNTNRLRVIESVFALWEENHD